MSTWDVTPQMVLDTTGQTVTTADVAAAGEIIDLYSNRTQSASGAMRVRDRVWLAKAVLWQAIKVAQEPDLFGKMTPSKIIQDGVEIDVTKDSDWMLAPLAARALKNLSWKGTRTRRPRTGRDPLMRETLPMNFLSESSDDLGKWDNL